MSKSDVVVITGGNRGLGFELAKVHLANGSTVLATHRRDLGGLTKLSAQYPDRLTLLHFDLVSKSDLEQFQTTVSKYDRIDVLINNAASTVKPLEKIDRHEPSQFLNVMWVNSIAPVFITQSCLPALLRANGRVVNLSSRLGSLTARNEGLYYPYRMSKAALNSFTTTLAADHPELIVVSVTPGLLKTTLGGPKAEASPEGAAVKLTALIGRLTQQQSGKFLDVDGELVPF